MDMLIFIGARIEPDRREIKAHMKQRKTNIDLTCAYINAE